MSIFESLLALFAIVAGPAVSPLLLALLLSLVMACASSSVAKSIG